MKRKRSISACIMAKNEEKLLPNCLKSLKPLVDEIILVDTGSTDRTVDIAKMYGAKVYFHDWNDDFSAMRNLTLKYATGDWCLWIDADEELDSAGLNAIREACESELEEAYHLRLINILKGSGTSEFNALRLWRNRSKYRFTGIIHEQLTIEGTFPLLEARIIHHGYNLDDASMKKKYRRSVKLLKKQITKTPDDPFPCFNLARAYQTGNEDELAFNMSIKTIEMLRKDEFFTFRHSMYAAIFPTLFTAALQINRLEEVAPYLVKVKKEFPEYIDIDFCLGSLYAHQNNEAKAIEHLEQYFSGLERFKKLPWISKTEVLSLGNKPHALNYLGQMYCRVGKVDKAISCFREIKDICPAAPDSYNALGHIYRGQGDIARAIKYFMAAVQRDPLFYPPNLALGLIYISQGKCADAEGFLKNVVTHRSADLSHLQVIGRECCNRGLYSIARIALERIVAMNPNNPENYFKLGLVFMKQKKWGHAKEQLQEALRLKPDYLEVKALLSKINLPDRSTKVA